MTPQEFGDRLRKLRLAKSSPLTLALLGVSVRQVFAYCSGSTPVPGAVARLLILLGYLNWLGKSPEEVAAHISARERKTPDKPGQNRTNPEKCAP